MPAIRKVTPYDFLSDDYGYLDLATRNMLARRANLQPGCSVDDLKKRQTAANADQPAAKGRITWDDTPARNAEERRATERVEHRTGPYKALCSPAPHDKTLLELQGNVFDIQEYQASIHHYVRGNKDHPLVHKFGWGKSPKAVQVGA